MRLRDAEKESGQQESYLKLDESVHRSIDMDVHRETFKQGSHLCPPVLFHKETQTLQINTQLVSPARVLSSPVGSGSSCMALSESVCLCSQHVKHTQTAFQSFSPCSPRAPSSSTPALLDNCLFISPTR